MRLGFLRRCGVRCARGAPPIPRPRNPVDPPLSPELDDLLTRNVAATTVSAIRSHYPHLSHEKAVYVLRTRTAADELQTTEANTVHLSELIRAEMYVDAVHFASSALPKVQLRIIHRLFSDLRSAETLDPSGRLTREAVADAVSLLIPSLIEAWQAEAVDTSTAAMAALWTTLRAEDVAYATSCIAHAASLLAAGGRIDEADALVVVSATQLALPPSPELWHGLLEAAPMAGAAADAAANIATATLNASGEDPDGSSTVAVAARTAVAKATAVWQWASRWRSAHSQRPVGVATKLGDHVVPLPPALMDAIQQVRIPHLSPWWRSVFPDVLLCGMCPHP